MTFIDWLADTSGREV